MGIYLNPGVENLELDRNTPYYVDKSLLISKLNSLINTNSRFVCVSRPRRFGKTMAVNMITAYYSKDCDSHHIFSDLKIANDKSFEDHINKYNVLNIDINGCLCNKNNSLTVVDFINQSVVPEIVKSYPNVKIKAEDNLAIAISKVYEATKEKFIIVLDEYDIIVREKDNKELESFLSFLNGIFKNNNVSKAIALAYLTGIFPIVRDVVQSKLNNFEEFTMLNAGYFSSFVGFTSSETKALCEQHNLDFEEVKRWYDGYNLNYIEIYSPKSVIDALRNNKCESYWTQTGSYEALKNFILLNFEGIKDDIISMISGSRVHVNVKKFLNKLDSFNSKDDVFTYLIHIGYLAYDHDTEECFIPNYEIKNEWIHSIENTPNYEKVLNVINKSRQLLNDTWALDSKAVAKSIEETHMLITNNLTYNNEDAFQSVIRLAYFYADSYYTIVNELPAGNGYADIVFIPYVPNKPAIVVELKRNKCVNTAINQIREKKYPSALELYKGNILLVGISYYEKSKKHFATIEKA